MGYFQVDSNGTYVNQYAWNKVANSASPRMHASVLVFQFTITVVLLRISAVLYLESPAGSGSGSGFSTCVKDSAPVACSWNDTSQAEAYAHTLATFFSEFPEFQDNDLYLTGESYAVR